MTGDFRQFSFLRMSMAAGLLSMALSAQPAVYEKGYGWKRSAQWVNGSAIGTTIGNPGLDTRGAEVWGNWWSEGNGLGSGVPWYATDRRLMLWDEAQFSGAVRYRWSRLSGGTEPAINRSSLTHSRTPNNGGAPYQAISTWTNPAGDGLRANIKGNLIVTWAGPGQAFLDIYDAELALVKYSSDDGVYTPLLASTLSRPDTPVATNRWTQEIPVSFSGIRFDAGDMLMVSINNAEGIAAPRAAWLLMKDSITVRVAGYAPVPMPSTSPHSAAPIPEPATVVLVLGGLLAIWKRSQTAQRR